MINLSRTGPVTAGLVAVTFAASCGSSSPADLKMDSPPRAVPSATEVFHLRSECASLGDKILDANIIGSALAQSQNSHYDEATNRCYVELTVHTADLQHYEDYYSRYLYDGQTGEMLAFATSKKGQRTSNIFLPHDSKNGTGDLFWDANNVIDKAMADDRGRVQGQPGPNKN